MTRLELLKKEKEAIKKMQTLSYNLIDQCCEWYDHEIECIEKYESPNPDVKDDSKDWIPCKDRLPDEAGEYFITWMANLGNNYVTDAIEIAEFDPMNPNKAWDLNHIYERGYRDVVVLAWMEIPEKWEGE